MSALFTRMSILPTFLERFTACAHSGFPRKICRGVSARASARDLRVVEREFLLVRAVRTRSAFFRKKMRKRGQFPCPNSDERNLIFQQH